MIKIVIKTHAYKEGPFPILILWEKISLKEKGVVMGY